MNCIQTLKVALNLSTAENRKAAMDTIVQKKGDYVEAGQIRSMPAGQYWTRCFGGCPQHGTYQNGAFWATPISYLVRCARVFDRNLHSRMPLSFTPSLRLKRCHACDQWHSSRVPTPLTSSHCKLRPNTEGLGNALDWLC
jgi:hypothetical protein